MSPAMSKQEHLWNRGMLPEDAQYWEGYVSERVKYFKRYATDKLIIAIKPL